jgi:putrescine aminotransferase
MRDRTDVWRAYERHVNRGQARLARVLGLPVEARAAGSRVYDEAGTEYLDCGGYGVFLLGHRHPAVVAAVERQLHRMPLSTRLFLNDGLARAAEALAAVVPDGLDRIAFAVSGAEAVELALKIGRSTGRRRIVAMAGGFHGKTLGALSATARERYRAPFLPLLPAVDHVPFGDAGALAGALAGGPPATVIVEPVQAEGGVRVPPAGYLAAVRQACDAHGALLVVDEIQTGLGRTGRWWGVCRDGVRPDVLLIGKALGGGVVPAAAVAVSVAAYAALDDEPLLHSSTFAGNPLAAAAACATLEVIGREDIVRRSAWLGDTLCTGLRELTAASGVVVAVRGAGTLIGVEFTAGHRAALFLEEMLNEQVIVSYSLNADEVVRFTPPAILDEADVARVLAAAAAALGRIGG